MDNKHLYQIVKQRYPPKFLEFGFNAYRTLIRYYNSEHHLSCLKVGPRDGLQNEEEIVPTSVKVELIKLLVSSGLPVVEAPSFVHRNGHLSLRLLWQMEQKK